MHSNPFHPNGLDISNLQRQINEKADKHELSSLERRLAALEHSLREISAENARLLHRCEILEESCREQVQSYKVDNSQFGVGA